MTTGPRPWLFRHPWLSLVLLTALGLGISYLRHLATGRPFSIGALVSVPLVYGTAAFSYSYHRRQQREEAERKS